jgi:hypothetical protein
MAPFYIKVLDIVIVSVAILVFGFIGFSCLL